MIIFSIIRKSQLEGATRLDAEYYQPEYLELENKITSVKFRSIKDLSEKVFSGPFGSTLKSESYQDSGIPFIRIGDISDIFIDKDNLVYISKKEHERIYSTHLNIGDIVLSKIATVGRLSVIDDELGEVNISENNIGIRLQSLDENIRAYTLFFLLSKFGQMQIFRRASGNIQLKLNVSDIESITLPITKDSQNKIFADYYSRLMIERKKFIAFYQQAENLLLEESGLKDFKNEESLFSIVNLSEMKNAKRFDAEYFQSKYEKLVKKIKGYSNKKLEDVVESVPAKFDVSKKPNETFKYVELSNINSSLGIIDGFSEVLGKEAPSRAKRILKVWDVIVSSVEGSLEKVALVNKEQEGNLASTGFFQFRSKDILPEVLLVIAKSIIFQMQLEKQCAGTILTAVPKEAIRNMIVPILPKETQQKIANLVRQSHEARKKAKELLEEAKRKVEEMIEKGT